MKIANKYNLNEWDDYYNREKKSHLKPAKNFFSYDIYLCRSILKKHIPRANLSSDDLKKMCEIGVGDGRLALDMEELLGYRAFGIEYVKSAADASRNLGINTICGDVFDKALLEKYKNYFDLVYSYGFVEHILPPEKAIDAHLALLKPGGYFFVQIPRIKGFNHWKVRLFRPDLIPLHNLDIMEESALREVCLRNKVEEIFCSKYGSFKLRIPLEKKNLVWYFFKSLQIVEYSVGFFYWLFFGEKGFETSFFSPALIFIGKKKDE